MFFFCQKVLRFNLVLLWLHYWGHCPPPFLYSVGGGGRAFPILKIVLPKAPLAAGEKGSVLLSAFVERFFVSCMQDFSLLQIMTNLDLWRKQFKGSFIKNNLKSWQPMKCTLGGVLQSCNVLVEVPLTVILFGNVYRITYLVEILFWCYKDLIKRDDIHI